MIPLHGWGRYPRITADQAEPLSAAECLQVLSKSNGCIGRGLGRSYGDSSLSKFVLSTRYLDHFLAFDETNGHLTCQAGVTFDQILRTFVPKGWFLPVTPGTRYVTVGGAIASDVHGKNHHVDGTLSEHVSEIVVMLGNGEQVRASSTHRSELFHATCGGMGLTGIILSATLLLRRVDSAQITQTIIKAPNLEAVLEQFEANRASTYSVAWIDCLATGRNLGRSLLMLGEHANGLGFTRKHPRELPVPFDAPDFLLSQTTARLFNAAHYHLGRRGRHTTTIPLERYFYPLDALTHWNRLYGKSGLLQYQFVIPKSSGAKELRNVLQRLASSGYPSFLGVLKVFGNENANLLSFPREGYTLALDFKVKAPVIELLEEIDQLVVNAGGRIYLTKDARMSESTFKASYPNWERFQDVRARHHALGRFSSLQSARLGLQ